MDIGSCGESGMLHEIDRVNLKLSGHSIVPVITIREGMPFDLGVFIDGKGFKFQVKSTMHPDDTGTMVFATCKEGGKPYDTTEIDYFLLYCAEPEWYGLALPSECGAATYVYNRPTKHKNSYQQEQLSLYPRFCELVETGNIQPLRQAILKNITSKETQSCLGTRQKYPKSTSEFLTMLADNDWNDESLMFSLNVSAATIQKWRKKFLC